MEFQLVTHSLPLLVHAELHLLILLLLHLALVGRQRFVLLALRVSVCSELSPLLLREFESGCSLRGLSYQEVGGALRRDSPEFPQKSGTASALPRSPGPRANICARAYDGSGL